MGQTTLFDLSNVDQILTLSVGIFGALPSLATAVDQTAIETQLGKVLAGQQTALALDNVVSTTLTKVSTQLSTLITDTNNSTNLVEALIAAIGQQFAAFAKLDVQNQQLALLNQIVGLVQGQAGFRPPTAVRFDIPRLLTKDGVDIMSGSVTVADDMDMRVPLKFTDAAGTVHAPSGGSVSSSDPTIATGDVAPDDTSIVIRTVADGSCVLTYTNGSLSDTLNVTVSIPVPTAVSLDAADAVPVAKGTPA